MFSEVLKQIKISLMLLTLFTILTGLLYPVLITGIAQILFPEKANGSLITKDNKVVGSLLIGQSFADPKYFWSRPSATSPFAYNAAASSGSNLGPSNLDYLATVKQRVTDLKQKNPGSWKLVPVELVTASGSGLDPEISPEAAFYQVPRIAKARGVPDERILAVINNAIIKPSLVFLGEPRVNVLQINLALDNIFKSRSAL